MNTTELRRNPVYLGTWVVCNTIIMGIVTILSIYIVSQKRPSQEIFI